VELSGCNKKRFIRINSVTAKGELNSWEECFLITTQLAIAPHFVGETTGVPAIENKGATTNINGNNPFKLCLDLKYLLMEIKLTEKPCVKNFIVEDFG